MALRVSAPDFCDTQVYCVVCVCLCVPFICCRIYACISVVILYATVHLKHATNYKLLQILTILHTSYRILMFHVHAFGSHTDEKE